MVQVVTIRTRQPVKLLPANGHGFSDKTYFAFCMANPDLNVERTAEGEIVIVPPAGVESSYRNMSVAQQLANWTQRDDRGKAFDSSAEFMLPDGSALSPDAAWVSNRSLAKLNREQKRKFPPLCPEFVVEVRSPSDRLKKAKEKMDQWIANGAQLGWLIDADHRTVYVYRPGRPVESRRGIQRLEGEGPVKGFALQLRSIWQGLR
jgi:Uma2 family endonuclease